MAQVKDITIYSPEGTAIATVLITKNSKRVVKLMEDDYIELQFSLQTATPFPIGSYCDDALFGRFYVTSEQAPDYNATTGGYDYKLKLEAWYKVWNQKEFMLTAVEVASQTVFRKETQWYLTASLKEQMREFMNNLRILGFVSGDFTTNDNDLDKYVDIREEVGTATQSLLMSYNSAYMVDALKAMANTWGCEYWVTGTEQSFVIHFGKCAEGTEQSISLKTAASIKPQNNLSQYGDRLFYFGSQDNIPNTYRKNIQLYATDIQTPSSASPYIETFLGKQYATDTTPVPLTGDLLGNKPFYVRFMASRANLNKKWTTWTGYKTTDNEEVRTTVIDELLAQLPAAKGAALYKTSYIRFAIEVDILDASGNVLETRDLTDEGTYDSSNLPSGASDYGKMRIKAYQLNERYDWRGSVFKDYESKAVFLEWDEWKKFADSSDADLSYSEYQNINSGTIDLIVVNDTFRMEYDLDKGYVEEQQQQRLSTLYINANKLRTLYTARQPCYNYNGDYSLSLDYQQRELLGLSQLPNVSDDYDDEKNLTSATDIKEWNAQLSSGYRYIYFISSYDFDWQSNMRAFAENAGELLTYKDEKYYFDGDIEMAYNEEWAGMLCVEPQPYTRKISEYITPAGCACQIIATDADTYSWTAKGDFGVNNGTVTNGASAVTPSAVPKDGYVQLNATQIDRVQNGNAYAREHYDLAEHVFTIPDKELDLSVTETDITLRILIRTSKNIERASMSVDINGGFGSGTDADEVPLVLVRRLIQAHTTFNTSELTKVGGGYVLKTTLHISASKHHTETKYVVNGLWPYMRVQLTDMKFFDAGGNSVEAFDRVNNDDVLIRVYDDASVVLEAHGSLLQTYKAYMDTEWNNGKPDADKWRIKFDEGSKVATDLFTDGTLFYIDSDSDWQVPYVYFVNAYDNPSSLKTIGEKRLMMPRYNEEDFERFGVKKYGMTYDEETETIYNADKTLAYRNGCIFRVGEEQRLYSKELTVVDNSIYPDGKLLVHSVLECDAKEYQKVQNETKDVQWDWTQYHVQLRRPGETEIIAFDYRMVLTDSDGLGIRFLIPEDMKSYKDENILTDAEWTAMKQNSQLSGMEFKCEHNAKITMNGIYTDADTPAAQRNEASDNLFTILRSSTYGGKLPNEVLKPHVGDPCVLTNWNVKAVPALKLVAEAEYKLLQKGFDYFTAIHDGNFTFNCTMRWEYWMRGDGGYNLPSLGQRVKVEHSALRQPSHTRIIGYTLKLDKPYDSAELICGETEAYSRLKQMEKNLQVQSSTGGSAGSGGTQASGSVTVVNTSTTGTATELLEDWGSYSPSTAGGTALSATLAKGLLERVEYLERHGTRTDADSDSISMVASVDGTTLNMITREFMTATVSNSIFTLTTQK